jgi:hypothetical protein
VCNLRKKKRNIFKPKGGVVQSYSGGITEAGGLRINAFILVGSSLKHHCLVTKHV